MGDYNPRQITQMRWKDVTDMFLNKFRKVFVTMIIPRPVYTED